MADRGSDSCDTDEFGSAESDSDVRKEDENTVAGTEDINESKQVTSDTVRAETGLLEESKPSTDMLEEHKDPTLLPLSEKVVDTEKEVKEGQECPASATKEPQTEARSAEEPSAWGWGSGWSSWGRSLITSSVSGVSDSAKALGRGLESVVTKVEESLGVPSPEELVEGDKDKGKMLEERKNLDMPEPQEIPADTREGNPEEPAAEEATLLAKVDLGGFLTGIASSVQSTGATLVSGSLDALETLGRKTVNVITEGDPGLRKKRAMLSSASESLTLSQLLREAKEKAENPSSSQGQGKDSSQTQLNYSILFDEYGGLVHLEALELLSKECSTNVRTTLSAFGGEELSKVKEQLDALAQCFQLEDDEEEAGGKEGKSERIEEMKKLVEGFGSKVKVDRLLKVCDLAREKSTPSATTTGEPSADTPKQDASEVLYENGLRCLAELCSSAMELLKKMGEVILLPEEVVTDLKHKAENLHRLTHLINGEIDGAASFFAETLTNELSDDADSRITSIYLEASNSCSYVQDAFKLLLPVFQLRMLQTQRDACTAES